MSEGLKEASFGVSQCNVDFPKSWIFVKNCVLVYNSKLKLKKKAKTKTYERIRNKKREYEKKWLFLTTFAIPLFFLLRARVSISKQEKHFIK